MLIQIVRVPNWPYLLDWCQIVRFINISAKLSIFSSCCHIVCLPSWCQIVRFYYLGAKLSGNKFSGCQIVRQLGSKINFFCRFLLILSGPLRRVVGQFGAGQFGTRTIWHLDSENGQISTKKANGQFGTKIRKKTIWHRQSKNGHFGTNIRKTDNLAPQFFWIICIKIFTNKMLE